MNLRPTPAKSVSHIVTYSSIMPGTAGSVIWPVTTDRRYNRRAMASRSSVGSTYLWGRFSIDPFYTTERSSARHRNLDLLSTKPFETELEANTHTAPRFSGPPVIDHREHGQPPTVGLRLPEMDNTVLPRGRALREHWR